MRRLIVVLLAVGLVLVGLDVAARAATQGAVARDVRASEGLTDQPQVDINGFPFLLQAARGRYDDVRVRLRGVPAGDRLRLDTVDARLTGVHLPVSAVFGSTASRIPVDEVHVSGTAGFAALQAQVNSAMPSGMGTVQLGDGGRGRLALTVNYTGLGGPLTISGQAEVAVTRGRLTISVPQDQLTDVPAPFRPMAARLLTQSLTLQDLPFGLVATGVSVTPQGLVVTAEAHDTVLEAQPAR